MILKCIILFDGYLVESLIFRQIIEIYVQVVCVEGYEVWVLKIYDMDFDMDYGFGGYNNQKLFEFVLEDFFQVLEWSEYFVIVILMWWGGLLVKLKGLIDCFFLLGWMFDIWVKLGIMFKFMFIGCMVYVFLMFDMLGWVFCLFYKDVLVWQIKGQIFNFVGFKLVRFMYFIGVSYFKGKMVEIWLKKVVCIGVRVGQCVV